MTTHLYAPPGDFPDTLCGLSPGLTAQPIAVYMCDLDRVDCPNCLARQEPQRRALAQLGDDSTEPYTEEDAARLRRGAFWASWFAAPLWAVLIVAVWRLLT